MCQSSADTHGHTHSWSTVAFPEHSSFPSFWTPMGWSRDTTVWGRPWRRRSGFEMVLRAFPIQTYTHTHTLAITLSLPLSVAHYLSLTHTQTHTDDLHLFISFIQNTLSLIWFGMDDDIMSSLFSTMFLRDSVFFCLFKTQTEIMLKQIPSPAVSTYISRFESNFYNITSYLSYFY